MVEFSKHCTCLTQEENVNNTLRKIQAFPHNFLLRKFFVSGQFLQIFGRFSQKSVEIALSTEKIFTRKFVGKACILRSDSNQYLTCIFTPFALFNIHQTIVTQLARCCLSTYAREKLTWIVWVFICSIGFARTEPSSVT